MITRTRSTLCSLVIIRQIVSNIRPRTTDNLVCLATLFNAHVPAFMSTIFGRERLLLYVYFIIE